MIFPTKSKFLFPASSCRTVLCLNADPAHSRRRAKPLQRGVLSSSSSAAGIGIAITSDARRRRISGGYNARWRESERVGNVLHIVVVAVRSDMDKGREGPWEAGTHMRGGERKIQRMCFTSPSFFLPSCVRLKPFEIRHKRPSLSFGAAAAEGESEFRVDGDSHMCHGFGRRFSLSPSTLYLSLSLFCLFVG